MKYKKMKSSSLLIAGNILLILLTIFPSGCKKEQEKEEEIIQDKPDIYAPELNEPGSPIVTKSGDFTVVVLPDTQCYTASKNNGTPKIFESQIDWIRNNQEKEKEAGDHSAQ